MPVAKSAPKRKAAVAAKSARPRAAKRKPVDVKNAPHLQGTYNHATWDKNGKFVGFVKKPLSEHPLAELSCTAPPIDFDKIRKTFAEIGGWDVKIPKRHPGKKHW